MKKECLLAAALVLALTMAAPVYANEEEGSPIPEAGTTQFQDMPSGENLGEKGEHPDRTGDFTHDFAGKNGDAMTEGPNGMPDGNRRMGMAGAGQFDKSSDEELQQLINELVPQYELLTFEDAESGTSLQYYLYTPTAEGESFPLVQFIPDSSVVGKEASSVLTQGWGGLIWADEEEQAQRPCYVVIPVFTETIVDDSANTSEQVNVAVRLIQNLIETLPIDADRVYTTGQSMGGMTSFHLNVTYPELFAASVFVGSQWDISVLAPLEEKTFFYIVAAGDAKASAGQSELKELFTQDGVSFAEAEWSAQEEADAQNAYVEALLEQCCDANFVTFTLGSTLTDGQSGGAAGEHMTSFDYAYKLQAVREWLFEQSK